MESNFFGVATLPLQQARWCIAVSPIAPIIHNTYTCNTVAVHTMQHSMLTVL